MGYLITQILIYLLLAAVIGFLVAWVIRGARLGTRIDELENDLWRVRNEPALGAGARPQEIEALRAERDRLREECERLRREAAAGGAGAAPGQPAPARAPRTAAAAGASPAGSAPQTLERPSGEADDLKRIKGIGPKIESLLHSLGVYHFHQIAAWTPENVAWVDEQLQFRGRIVRERWIEQAKALNA